MRRIGWIGVLSLVCAGMGAARMAAQNRTDHSGGSTSGTSYKRQQPAPVPRGTSAAATKATPTNTQKQPSVQPQPKGTLKPLQTTPYQSPSASTQAKGALATVPPPPSGSAPTVNSSDQMHINWQPTGASTTGSIPTPITRQNPAGSSTGSEVTGRNSTPAIPQNSQSQGAGSKETPQTGSNSSPSTTKDPPPVTGVISRQPSRWPPKGSPTPTPKSPPHPPHTPPAAIPSFGVVPLYGYRPQQPPQITSPGPSPLPLKTVQPPDDEQQPQQPPESAQSPTGPSPGAPPSTAQTSDAPSGNTPTPQSQASSTPDHSAGIPAIELPPSGQDPVIVKVQPAVALTLTTTASSLRPVVGGKIVVVPALTPAQAGASYLLDWGDGSAKETVSESGTHRYAKPQLYKVSAQATVGKIELHREILLQVGPVDTGRWKRFAALLMTIAGVGLWGMHTLVKVTTGCRWDVPKMKLLGRESYVSLSFVPDMGPAEERITFSKKRRRSG
jgi:hypothetical protein